VDEAGELLTSLQSRNPSVEHEVLLLLVNYFKGEKDKVRQAVQVLKSAHMQNGMVRLVDGIILILDGDLKKAEIEFKDIIQLAGQLPMAHYWFGRLKLAQDEKVWARSEFEQALRIQGRLSEGHV
jgi:TolA-binding protein